MDAPRALVFRPLVKGNEALGTRQPRSQGQLRFQDSGRHLESGVDPGNEVGNEIAVIAVLSRSRERTLGTRLP